MKDPAFLFYTSDFLTGTQFMSDEQVGVYIRILCAQHQHGHLSERKMQQLCRGIAGADAVQEVMCKFERDADGNFYNARLDQEINKRKEFAEKQRDKAKKRWRDKDAVAYAVALPGQCLLENENENENRNRKGNETAETKTEGTAQAGKGRTQAPPAQTGIVQTKSFQPAAVHRQRLMESTETLEAWFRALRAKLSAAMMSDLIAQIETWDLLFDNKFPGGSSFNEYRKHHTWRLNDLKMLPINPKEQQTALTAPQRSKPKHR